jgi:hypothetical protein
MSLTFSEGEGARRADEGLVIPLISLAALASFSQEKLFLQYVTEGLRSRRGEASFMTFPWGKVPAERMEVFLPSPREKVPTGRMRVL